MKKYYCLILVCLALGGCRRETRQPEVREFPYGFRGWAVIAWGVPSYPPLPEADGKLIERFPSDGVIITSTRMQFGRALDAEYYVDAGGQRLLERPRVAFGTVSGRERYGCKLHLLRLFIGTDAEHQAAGARAPQEEPLLDKLCPDKKTRGD
jgi:hypothetical protein